MQRERTGWIQGAPQRSLLMEVLGGASLTRLPAVGMEGKGTYVRGVFQIGNVVIS